jgi:hypothetical protein
MVSNSRTRTRFRVASLIPTVIGILLGGEIEEVAAQQGTIRVEENLRAEPSGTIIGRLSPRTPVVVGQSQGDWSRVTIEGFVWAQSLQLRTSGSFDLIVAVSEGENLRESPAGTVLGQLDSGTLLEEIERIPGWIRVRRTAWIWTPSLTLVAARVAAPPSGRAGGAAAGAPASTPSASAALLAPVAADAVAAEL